MLYVSVQYYITDEVKMYDSLHLHTVYSAADNIPWVQSPKPCVLLECCLQFFFVVAIFAKLVLAKDLRLCKKK